MKDVIRGNVKVIAEMKYVKKLKLGSAQLIANGVEMETARQENHVKRIAVAVLVLRMICGILMATGG